MDLVRNNRILSLLGQRGAFGAVLHDLAKTDDKIVALAGDLTRVAGLEHFADDFPERFINAGIAEQNMLGLAAGIADAGRVPFAATFANFAALRANEFARHFMAYMRCNVKLVGFCGGFAIELFGTTHYGLEDVAALRSMPNLTILSPCDCMEVAKCVEYCTSSTGPVYLRLTGKLNAPMINKCDYNLEVGRGIKLREGCDAVIYATGSVVFNALKAAEMLSDAGIDTVVINMHTLKPIDEELIVRHKDVSLIVSVEEHSVVGGLGSAVAEVLAVYHEHGRLIAIGTDDTYLHAGSYEYMLEQHGLTAAQICARIINEFRTSNNI